MNLNLLVYQTEVVSKNLNPQFQPFDLNLGKLCNGDIDLPIVVEIWDHKSKGPDQLIGTTQFTISEVNGGKKEFKFTDARKKKGNLGILIFDSFKVNDKPQFIDYIKGGTQLALHIAVDFTISNGDPNRKDSLHCYDDLSGMNAYQKAISATSEILLNYDHDKMVPMYGFGGKPKFHNLTSLKTMHCFPMNGKVEDPYCEGLAGIMEAYSHALKHVILDGPTLFAPMITKVMDICKQSKRDQDNQYYILLLLTDGEINDMERTKTAIVDSSHLPLSIIIIGIGNADFEKMDILDGDDGLWDASGRKAERDLVQFVPFNKFAGDPVALAAHVLEELPFQLTEYMRLVGIMPGKVENQDIVRVRNNEGSDMPEPAGPRPCLEVDEHEGKENYNNMNSPNFFKPGGLTYRKNRDDLSARNSSYFTSRA